ncbi:MAG: CARDB domain-containing protein [Candidatus Bathyarchaeia archaeon]
MKTSQKTLYRGLCLILTALLTLTFIPTPQLTAQQTKTIYVDPPAVIYTTDTATIGTRFNITVRATSTTYPWNLMMWQVYINYNDTLINVTETFVSSKWVVRAWPNNYLGARTFDTAYIFYGQAGGAIGQPTYYHLGPGQGALMLGDLLMSDYAVPAAAILCIIEFEIKTLPAEGQTLSCALNINNDNTFLYDSTGPIPATIQDGYYEISRPGVPPPMRTLTIHSATGGTTVPAAGTYSYANGTTVNVTAYPSVGYTFSHWTLDAQVKTENPISILMDADHDLTPAFSLIPTNKTRVFVDPPEIIDPTLLPCSTFTINITVDDVFNMQGLKFNLSYDTFVLSVVGIMLHRVSGQLPTANFGVDDDIGEIWVKATYPAPVSTVDPTALIEIIFHVEHLGSSVLDLHDTQLLDPEEEPIEHDVYDGFFMSLIRDVAVINVVPSRTWAYQGWPVTIAVTVKNLGNISETFDAKAYYGSTLIGMAPVVNLPPNTEQTVLINWDTSSVGEGTYTIKGEATTVPYEYDTTNNIYVDGTVMILTTIRDVAITNIQPEQNWAYEGWTIHVWVTAENLGELPETFNVTLRYDSTIIGTQEVTNLPPHTAVILDFLWNTSTAEPCHNYTLSAEASEIPYEFDSTNNLLVDGNVKIRIMGDVDGNGQVNMLDLYLVGLSFGYAQGEPGYNVYADVDRNGFINMLDMWIVARNFGRSC